MSIGPNSQPGRLVADFHHVTSGRLWFLALAGLTITAHLFLRTDARAWTFVLSSAVTIVPIAHLLRRTAAGLRGPWWMLFAAMIVLTVANALNAFDTGPATVDLLITVGHATLLAGATALVLRRGRNDIGGMLDLTVGAIGLAGLLWTALLSPRLERLGTGQGAQLPMLVSVLALAGVLGALLRLWLTDRRLHTLRYLIFALFIALVGNGLMAWTNGTETLGRSGGVELLFMAAYSCVGFAVLDPTVHELTRSTAGPVDRLTVARLVFLGIALLVGPLTAGLRHLAGLDTDGALLAVGSLLITPLVMIRVGRLARQRERAEALLRHQATHDLLTGLPNRAELLDRLAAALDRERSTGRPAVVLLFCDLNGFKQINDRLGHVAGDQLLTDVAERLGSGLQSGDTLARYGGDEFLLLCEHEDQQPAMQRLRTHVRQSLAAPFLLAGEEVTIGSSVGAVLSDGSLGADELISRADQEMYAAKQRQQSVAFSSVGSGSVGSGSVGSGSVGSGSVGSGSVGSGSVGSAAEAEVGVPGRPGESAGARRGLGAA
jgi:diguanylate cyclase (GGDEF)-like protein